MGKNRLIMKGGVFVGINVLNRNIYRRTQPQDYHYIGNQNAPTRRRATLWNILFVCLICLLVIGCCVLPSRRFITQWYLFSSKTITRPSFQSFGAGRQFYPTRQLTDEELNSRAIVNGILAMPYVRTPISKIAFMFMTPGSLPLEKLWEKFFLVRKGRPIEVRSNDLNEKFMRPCVNTSQGHENMFSIYVHASKKHPIHTSKLFVGRDIQSSQARN